MPSKLESTESREFFKRILEAIIRKIEGAKDLKRRLDYLMKPEVLETSSILSETQLQGINECCWLGESFPSMEPLKDFAQGLAKWSISKDGKGREQAMNTMITGEKKGILEGLGIHVHEATKEGGKTKK